MKLYALGDDIVQAYDPRFTIQSQDELEEILNEDQQ